MLMAPPSRAEQNRIEALWQATDRAYGEALRRQNCVAWTQHHARLARAFHDHAARHEEEQAHYEALLAEMHTTTKGGSYAEASTAA
jgi:hypothetical protein